MVKQNFFAHLFTIVILTLFTATFGFPATKTFPSVSESKSEEIHQYSFCFYATDWSTGTMYYQKKPLEVKTDEFVVQYKPETTHQAIQQLNSSYEAKVLAQEKHEDYYVLKVPDNFQVRQLFTAYGKPHLKNYGNDSIVEYVGPVFISPFEEKRMVATNKFIVQFKSGVDESQLENLNRKHSVNIVRKSKLVEGEYILQVTRDSDLNPVEMANLYHEQAFVEYATPDFLFPFSFENPSPAGRGPKITEHDWGDEYFVEINTFDGKTRYVANEIIAKVKPDVTADRVKSIIAKYQGELRRFDPSNHIFPHRRGFSVIRVPNAVDIFMVVSILNQHPLFEYAEQNGMAVGQSLPTNDGEFVKQWYLHNTGQSPPLGTPDADIDLPEAWDITMGSSSVVVAVLDTGIDLKDDNQTLDHPDLDDASRIILGDDHVRTDGDDHVRDFNGHGTRVAGVVGAEVNNGGMVGVAPLCKLLIIQVLDASKNGTSESGQNGIDETVEYAQNHPGECVVINFSSTFDKYSNPVYFAIQNARDNGCLFVTSTGNNGNGQNVAFPATLTDVFNNVIAVGGTDYHD